MGRRAGGVCEREWREEGGRERDGGVEAQSGYLYRFGECGQATRGPHRIDGRFWI